jgi:ATP-binding cassette subfamily B protein
VKIIKGYFVSVKFAFKYLFKFAKSETIALGLINALQGALPYGTAFLLGKLVDVIVSGTTNSGSNYGLWAVLLLYAVVSSLPSITGNLYRYTARKLMINMQAGMEIEIAQMRERIDIAKYEDPQFLDLLQRTFRQGPNPLYQLGRSQFDIIQSLTSLVVGTILAINFSWIIYIVVIFTAIPSFIVDIKFAGQSWSIWAKDSPGQRRLGDLRQHIFSRYMLIETKLLQSSNKIFKWMEKIMTEFSGAQLGVEKKIVWYTSLTDVLSLVGFVIGLILVVKTNISGVVQVGSVVYIISTLTNVRKSIANLLKDISGQFENHLIVQDMIEVSRIKPVIIEKQNPVLINLTHAPEIRFENVGFKYDNSDKWSLRNVNLTFNAGDNIGLVGNNGAGKTTLVKLLCRIYDPTEGRILINGVDLKDVATKEWWSYLAIMFQDYASYDFLVKEAIAIGRPDKNLNLTKVIEASKVSQSHEFIVDWKDKYDEQLGVEFKGKEPSKGQRQKLSIAKTLYRDGYVMVLDEPTASVDAESEAKIFDSIENLPKDRTAILISHDFSTISQCDKIFVLENGGLIEEGTHKDLMKQKGKYAELYNLQAKRFKK